MKRFLFNVPAGASLLLCVAIVGLWIRSYRVDEKEWWDDFAPSSAAGGEGYCVESGDGRLAFFHRFFDETDHDSIAHPVIPWHFPAGTDRLIRVPDLFVAAMLTVLPIAKCFGWWKRRRRLVLGARCRSCGYDLRASPERCPECGTAVVFKTCS